MTAASRFHRADPGTIGGRDAAAFLAASRIYGGAAPPLSAWPPPGCGESSARNLIPPEMSERAAVWNRRPASGGA
jgi:hypothetical protein